MKLFPSKTIELVTQVPFWLKAFLVAMRHLRTVQYRT